MTMAMSEFIFIGSHSSCLHVAETMMCMLLRVEVTVNSITVVNIHVFQNTHTLEMFTVLGGCIDW
jgi:hypothetical protein